MQNSSNSSTTKVTYFCLRDIDSKHPRFGEVGPYRPFLLQSLVPCKDNFVAVVREGEVLQ